MKHEVRSRYPVSSDVILRMFANPEFHAAKLQGLALKSYKVLEQHAQGDEFRIRIERKVGLEAPALVRKVVPTEATAISEERWNLKTRKGRVSINPGIPVEMSCEVAMADTAGECVVIYTWDVRARIPLIGGPLERFICSDLESKMVDETRVTTSLIPQYRGEEPGR